MKTLWLLTVFLTSFVTSATDFRGAEFLGFSSFTNFTSRGDELISEIIGPKDKWDELVISWNVGIAGKCAVEVKAELVVSPERVLAQRIATWRVGTNRFSAQNEQTLGEFGKLDCDTVKLAEPGTAGVRVILKFFDGARAEHLKFLGLSFRNSTVKPEVLEANRRARGKVVEVRTRSQLDYPEGAKIWCSPTSTSMILDYWSQQLNRSEMSLTVPEVARLVHDVVYKGTGNWTFNTAFAGCFPRMRGYVTRLTDVSELEDWIEAGIPVATSVSYNRLKGRGTNGSGHLIVCVGFNEAGDIVVNDPGTQLSNVRRTFSRDLFRQAWADSGNTVYIIYPEGAKIPKDRFGHWER